MIQIRRFTMKDYPAAFALWQRSEGISLGEADSRENIARYLRRNAGLSFVAYDGDRLVGAVLCGHDGRRGYLHHLAVVPEQRGRGIGLDLASQCEATLRACGIPKCHLFVRKDNARAAVFWNRIGWRERHDISIMSRDLNPAG